MSLSVSYVSCLDDVLARARLFLGRQDDVFAKPRIVVPNAGTKAWLVNELARTLGAGGDGTAGTGDSPCDGIVANVDISFPGTILSLMQPGKDGPPDPWEFDRLTFAVLDVITGPDAAELGIPCDVRREPLLASRRIAGLFDEYHVRRPGMILEWEKPQENAVLEPTANDVQVNGEPVPAALRDADQWQFRLWRMVRRRIDAPSPPARRSIEHDRSRQPLLVAGLQSLTLPQLTCLESLATSCDVEVLLIQPAPGLRPVWSASGQQPLAANLRDRPLLKHRDPEFPPGVDPLPQMWLSGARELQDLLAGRGTAVTEIPAGDRPQATPNSLLARMQRTIASGNTPAAEPHDPSCDRSVVIHRCHSLSRQAEVLHDALLQAFAQIPGLQPHDVAVMSPCLEKAVPHLQAVFQRTVTGRDATGTPRQIALPLVVADRGIRETSDAADLLAALVSLPGSRASVDDVLGLAGHPLVRTTFGVDDDTVASWTDFVERTAVRWGLDSAHRRRHGLSLEADADIHTWKLGVERMLLGAMLPDATARTELGGVMPLDDLESIDMPRITKLVRILDILRTLEAGAVGSKPVAEWCDLVEQALVDLCGEECQQLAEPLAHLGRLRRAAAGTAGERVPVPFEDVRGLLVTWLDEATGRQPLRTGAITATSMVPLRGVPFKVVCVIGYDDGAVGAGEADGDDLVSRQQIVGDGDPRVDERRALLDCVLAAETRLVITCNGRNAKSNKRVPLVTPLAELVDFAVRHGVARDALDAASGIEVDHPRHHLSHRNFAKGGVETGNAETGGVWSHDRIAGEVLAAVERTREQPSTQDADGPQRPPTAAAATTPEPALIDISLLERLIRDPLGLYLRETLGIDTWRDEDEPTPATLPLTLGNRQARTLTLELLRDIFTLDADAARATGDAWVAAKRASGILPIGPHVRRQVDEIAALATGLKAGLMKHLIDYPGLRSQQLADRPQIGRHRVGGLLEGIHTADPADAGERAPSQLVVVTAATSEKDRYNRPLHEAALHLLVARATGIDAECVRVISRHSDWRLGALKPPGVRNPGPRPADSWKAWVVTLHPSLATQEAAARRLDEIVDLAREAIREPRPAFSKVLTANADGREAAFEKALDEEFYWRSSECAFFGVAPSFAAVFTDHPERLAFIDAFQRLFAIDYENGKYVLA